MSAHRRRDTETGDGIEGSDLWKDQPKYRPLFSRRFLEVHRVNQVMRQRRQVAIGCELVDVRLMATFVAGPVWSLRRLNRG